MNRRGHNMVQLQQQNHKTFLTNSWAAVQHCTTEQWKQKQHISVVAVEGYILCSVVITCTVTSSPTEPERTVISYSRQFSGDIKTIISQESSWENCNFWPWMNFDSKQQITDHKIVWCTILYFDIIYSNLCFIQNVLHGNISSLRWNCLSLWDYYYGCLPSQHF